MFSVKEGGEFARARLKKLKKMNVCAAKIKPLFFIYLGVDVGLNNFINIGNVVI